MFSDPSLLNGLLGWQVAKQVRSLVETASIEELEVEGASASGFVSTAGRRWPVRIKLLSAKLMEGSCGCPAYRRDGLLCAHVGLLYLAACGKEIGGGKRGGDSVPTVRQSAASVAYRLELPPRWLDLWSRAVLPVRVETMCAESPSAADESLAEWLGKKGVAPDKPPPTLALSAGEVRHSFFEAVAGHESFFSGKDRIAVEPEPLLIPLQLSSAGKDCWMLTPQLPEGRVCLGEFVWDPADSRLSPQGTVRSLPGLPPETGAALLSGKPCRVSSEGLLRSLDALQERFVLDSAAQYEALQVLMPAPVFRFRWDGSLSCLCVVVFADYGTGKGDFPLIPRAPDVGELRKTGEGAFWKRDESAEAFWAYRLQSRGFSFTPRGWFLTGQEEGESFWTEVFPAWEHRADCAHVIDAALLKETRSLVRLSPALVERSSSGEDWLEASFVFADSAGVHYPAGEILKMIRAGKRKMKLPGGRTARFDVDGAGDWSALLAETEVRQKSPDEFVIASRSVPVFRSLMGEREAVSAQERADFSGFLTRTCRFALRPYQREGVLWAWKRLTVWKGGILGDDMGLGKTLQTLSLFALMREYLPGMKGRPSLIVAPASLLSNWKEEAERAFPGMDVVILHGAGREDVPVRELGVTTYALLSRDFARHKRAGYGLLAFDEASFVRNPDTDAADALRRIPAKYKLALTGTPVENGVRDLWSIFEIILPGYLGTRKAFKDSYETPLGADSPDRGVLRRLRCRVAPWILRRTKAEVAPELPPKIISVRWCELPAEHKTLYHALLTRGHEEILSASKKQGREAARMVMLTTLLRLRQLCDDARLLPGAAGRKVSGGKMESFLELVREMGENGRRTLVFSQFASFLRLAARELEERKIPFLLLDGSTRNRGELVSRFQNPEGPPVFLISLKAGGYGMNLQAADCVVHLDPWWNPAVEAQATDRAYRLGQTRTVNVYKMICRGTVEEKILRLQERKSGYLNAMLEDDASLMRGLDDGELEELLSL